MNGKLDTIHRDIKNAIKSSTSPSRHLLKTWSLYSSNMELNGASSTKDWLSSTIDDETIVKVEVVSMEGRPVSGLLFLGRFHFPVTLGKCSALMFVTSIKHDINCVFNNGTKVVIDDHDDLYETNDLVSGLVTCFNMHQKKYLNPAHTPTLPPFRNLCAITRVSMEHPPPEIQEDTLIRLSVRDLIRCKSVCKSWCKMISRRDFIRSHLNHSYLSDQNNNAFGDRRLVISRWRGYCHGLVCASHSYANIVVVNPSTTEVKKVTEPQISRTDYGICWGFGYDETTDDYKVFFGYTKGGKDETFTVPPEPKNMSYQSMIAEHYPKLRLGTLEETEEKETDNEHHLEEATSIIQSPN
nr:hypothetical protein [Tanacetum cinerariifolium]